MRQGRRTGPCTVSDPPEREGFAWPGAVQPGAAKRRRRRRHHRVSPALAAAQGQGRGPLPRRAGERDRESLRRRTAHAGLVGDDTLVYRVAFHVVPVAGEGR